MSWARSAVGGDRERRGGPDDWRRARWRGRGWTMRWTAFELIAMALGFIVFWPIGLAALAYKLWQSKFGGDDLEASSRRAGARRAAPGPRRPGAARRATTQARAATPRSTPGRRPNSPAWKRSGASSKTPRAISRTSSNRVRRARDREEFERFIQERREREQAGA